VEPAQPFAKRLLDWWDRHGRKDLPWQHPRSAYRVWISEIMLQQTQVATVIPYFERWMQRFPDIGILAAADPDEVLAHWAGLGYYARARNVHRAAVACVAQQGGELPSTAAALEELPGIGRSTAHAIVSLSTGQPAAILDGNVRRVLARHARVEGWSGSAPVQKLLWREAESRLPTGRGDDYSQAIMDLGALLCTRSNPACGDCPVSGDCGALLADAVDRYPAPRPGTRVREQSVYFLIARDEKQRVLLEKRPAAGIWGGLWCLPDASDLPGLERKTGLELGASRLLPERKHRLSHILMYIHPVMTGKLRSTQVRCSGQTDWFDVEQQEELGVPKPVADLLRELKSGEIQ